MTNGIIALLLACWVKKQGTKQRTLSRNSWWLYNFWIFMVSRWNLYVQIPRLTGPNAFIPNKITYTWPPRCDAIVLFDGALSGYTRSNEPGRRQSGHLLLVGLVVLASCSIGHWMTQCYPVSLSLSPSPLLLFMDFFCLYWLFWAMAWDTWWNVWTRIYQELQVARSIHLQKLGQPVVIVPMLCQYSL